MTKNSKSTSSLIHLSTYLGWFIPFAGVLAPLIIWLCSEDDEFITKNGKECVNFHISMAVWYVLSAILCYILIGFVFLLILFVIDLICPIQASIASKEGSDFKYPLTIRFL